METDERKGDGTVKNADAQFQLAAQRDASSSNLLVKKKKIDIYLEKRVSREVVNDWLKRHEGASMKDFVEREIMLVESFSLEEIRSEAR